MQAMAVSHTWARLHASEQIAAHMQMTTSLTSRSFRPSSMLCLLANKPPYSRLDKKQSRSQVLSAAQALAIVMLTKRSPSTTFAPICACADVLGGWELAGLALPRWALPRCTFWRAYIAAAKHQGACLLCHRPAWAGCRQVAACEGGHAHVKPAVHLLRFDDGHPELLAWGDLDSSSR